MTQGQSQLRTISINKLKSRNQYILQRVPNDTLRTTFLVTENTPLHKLPAQSFIHGLAALACDQTPLKNPCLIECRRNKLMYFIQREPQPMNEKNIPSLPNHQPSDISLSTEAESPHMHRSPQNITDSSAQKRE